MKQYILSVMLVGVISSIVTILSPEGGLRDHVRLAAGIVTVAVCILPLTSIVSELKELDIEEIIGDGYEISDENYEEIFESEFRCVEIEGVKEGIKAILEEKYGIGYDECYVSVKTAESEDGKRRLERVFINLYGGAILKNTAEIEEYLGELFGCEIVTAVG